MRPAEVRAVGSRVAAAIAVTVVLSGCALTSAHPGGSSPSPTGPAAGTPIRVSAAPVSPPVASLKGHSCLVSGAADRSEEVPDRGVVNVDPRPLAGVAEWLPGFNQRPCRAQLTHLGQTTARRLAAAVDGGQAIDVGAAYNCAAGDYSRVILFFRFPGRVVETVTVELNGCGWITAPGRTARFAPAAMRTELATLAPPPWRT